MLMKLKDVMTRSVRVTDPKDTVQDVAQMMRAADIGAVPVCDGERLCGIVTDRDLALRAVAEGRDPKTTRVSEVMSTQIVYLFEEDDVDKAAELMESRAIRRLIVLDRDKRLAGIVTLGDLSQQPEERRRAHEVLDRVSEAPPQHLPQ
jgi:CBS domain-containing protein